MAGEKEVLSNVTVKFEKAFKGVQATPSKRGEGKNGPWVLWEYKASFLDETGQTKTHKTRSFKYPGPVGSTLAGDLELYHGEGSNGPYVSYTFQPERGSPEFSPDDAPQTPTPATRTQPVSVPLEVREAASRKLIKAGYFTTRAAFKEILDKTPKEHKVPTKALLGKGFIELWKCAVMSLKLDADVWPDLIQEARDEYAEKHGMPNDKDIDIPEKDEKIAKLVEKTEGKVEEPEQPREEATEEDFSDIPF